MVPREILSTTRIDSRRIAIRGSDYFYVTEVVTILHSAPGYVPRDDLTVLPLPYTPAEQGTFLPRLRNHSTL